MTTGKSSYAVTAWIFLRLLGAIYAVAFFSLSTQIVGLVGQDGILPAHRLLEAARAQLGIERYWALPTVYWLNAGDAGLYGLCLAGAIGALLLLLDVAPALMAALLWAAYLSLATICRDFLAFQWDSLLLETGFLAILLAPPRLWPRQPRQAEEPSHAAVWLLRWLLLRLMFSSGVVKLASGDAAWRGLTALTRHYETQPLPTWVAWYAHQLPAAFHQLSCLGVFMLELVVPWLILCRAPIRRVACGALVGFQLLIMATGNYCFFNLLTIALCVLLLDDAIWPAAWRAGLSSATPAAREASRGCWPMWIIAPATAFVLGLSLAPVSGLMNHRRPWSAPMLAVARWAAPWRLVNGYGLFAVMTMERPEIVIEGSDDGQTWRAYEFRYKPGDPSRRPEFVAPHQPRLDWQMWFAALGTYQDDPWFLPFCRRLLEGSPSVLALLAHNPFPEHPPRYLRAMRYRYQFTDGPARHQTGAWWRRTLQGPYAPAMSLRQGSQRP